MKSCYCCTCADNYDRTPSDPYCRNHGHAGVRACEKHESADLHQGVDEDGKPLATVQQVYAAKSWNEADKAKAFLEDIVAVCRKHSMSLGHEDGHGLFLVHPEVSEFHLEWLRSARVEAVRQ